MRRPQWQRRLAAAIGAGMLGLAIYEGWDPASGWAATPADQALRVFVASTSLAAGLTLLLGLVHRYLGVAAVGLVELLALFTLDALRRGATEGTAPIAFASLGVFAIGLALTAILLRPELRKLRD